jgi:hypothetical protein
LPPVVSFDFFISAADDSDEFDPLRLLSMAERLDCPGGTLPGDLPPRSLSRADLFLSALPAWPAISYTRNAASPAMLVKASIKIRLTAQGYLLRIFSRTRA